MKNLVTSIWQFYVDGFRSMTLGRTLWLIIAIKLFIMFFILRLFFFRTIWMKLPEKAIKKITSAVN